MANTKLSIDMHPDQKIGPRYTADVKELDCTKVVVTEKGTESGLPIVDFQLKDKDGKEYFFCMTGRLANALSAVIKGTNLRNHGVEEP